MKWGTSRSDHSEVLFASLGLGKNMRAAQHTFCSHTNSAVCAKVARDAKGSKLFKGSKLDRNGKGSTLCGAVCMPSGVGIRY